MTHLVKKKNKNILLIMRYILAIIISLLSKHIEKIKSHDFDGFVVSYSQDKKAAPS